MENQNGMATRRLKHFADKFTHFDRIHERDRRTDGRTDGHHTTAYAALMHNIARQKV